MKGWSPGFYGQSPYVLSASSVVKELLLGQSVSSAVIELLLGQMESSKVKS